MRFFEIQIFELSLWLFISLFSKNYNIYFIIFIDQMQLSSVAILASFWGALFNSTLTKKLYLNHIPPLPQLLKWSLDCHLIYLNKNSSKILSRFGYPIHFQNHLKILLFRVDIELEILNYWNIIWINYCIFYLNLKNLSNLTSLRTDNWTT